MAAVSVTPIMDDRVVVVPSMLSPSVASCDIMYGTIAPMLPSISAPFNAWRPGNSSGAESSRPAQQQQEECSNTYRVKLEVDSKTVGECLCPGLHRCTNNPETQSLWHHQ